MPQAPLDVQFDSNGMKCSAYLYRPATEATTPIIVMAHGLGGTRRMRLTAFAERFVAEGYACLVFDYRYFGDSEGQPRQLLDIKSQLKDWKAAIAYARSLDKIDPNRVVIWGTSFGGGHVLATAADDNRLAAVISQCPFTDGFSSSMAMNPITTLKLTALALKDKIGSILGAKPVMVPLAGPSGHTALMNAPDAYSGYLALMPSGSNIPNHVAARFVLDIIRYYRAVRHHVFKRPCCFVSVIPTRWPPQKQHCVMRAIHPIMKLSTTPMVILKFTLEKLLSVLFVIRSTFLNASFQSSNSKFKIFGERP